MEQCVIGHYEASEARKVALCENKEKTGPKKVNEIKESIDKDKKTSASGIKRSRYHQPDILTKPSSSKEIVASRIKISALAAEDFTGEVSDGGDLIEAKRQGLLLLSLN